MDYYVIFSGILDIFGRIPRNQHAWRDPGGPDLAFLPLAKT
jgi:hypothetical protein